jgi:hypothetical protein
VFGKVIVDASRLHSERVELERSLEPYQYLTVSIKKLVSDKLQLATSVDDLYQQFNDARF